MKPNYRFDHADENDNTRLVNYYQKSIHPIVVYLLVLTGELLKVLNRFYKRKEMQKLAADQGLDGKNLTHLTLNLSTTPITLCYYNSTPI